MQLNRAEEVWAWVEAGGQATPPHDIFCPSQDLFQSRINTLLRALAAAGQPESRAFLLAAVAGEIGNNSFDHNLGRWPDARGICFSHGVEGGGYEVVLADRGLGVLETLRRVRPGLRNDAQALQVAFTEKVSGRAPENRGNGLKFVREAIRSDGLSLHFHSGKATAVVGAELRLEVNSRPFRGCLAILRTR